MAKEVSVAGFLLLGSMLVAQAQPMIVRDPPEEATRVLADWQDSEEMENFRWRPELASRRARIEAGFVRLESDGRLELRAAPPVNDFPFIRFRLGGPPEPQRRITISAEPHEEENTRRLSADLAQGGREYGLRLPPDRVLTRIPYVEGGEWKWELENSGNSLAIDYIMADSVRTAAIAEFNADFPEDYDIDGVGAQHVVEDGMLRLLLKSLSSVRFEPSGRADEYNFDTLDLRLRASDPEGGELNLQLSWKSTNGGEGELTVPLPVDGHFHRFRIYFQKEESFRIPLEQIRLEFPDARYRERPILDIDYIRLRDFPSAGGGFIADGIYDLRRHQDEWAQTLSLVDHWRFVAGQSYKGNQKRLWNILGRIFRRNKIRWETDHPTWQWMEEDKISWPRKPDGSPDLKAAARNAYEDINPSAQYLAEQGDQLHAVHFDGLLKRLIMPWGHPHAGDKSRSTGGGLYEYANNDFKAAYRLAAETFCEFLTLCRNEPDSALKETRFYIQPNFHVWAWRHGALDYERLFTRLPDPGNFAEMMAALEEVDAEYLAKGAYEAPSPLAGYGADWVFMDPQKRRLVSYEWLATELYGRDFNVVNNGSQSGVTPEEIATETLHHLLKFRERGGRPTTFTPYYWQTTWREAPVHGPDAAVLPETKPHTIMWATLESAKLCLQLSSGIPLSP